VVRAPLDRIVDAAGAAGVQSPATLVIGEVTASRDGRAAAASQPHPAAASA
jgi:hypothetical protein